MRRTTSLLTILLLLCTITTAGAAMTPVKKVRAGLPPYDVTGNIVRHNDQVLISETEEGQADKAATPHLVWLADFDARVQPTLIYPDPVAKIHAVRNVANQLSLSAGAIDYGINHLLSPVLLITGNTDSDSLRLFRQDSREISPELRQDLDRLRPALSGTTGNEGSPGNESAPEGDALLVERNVDYQVAEAVKRYRQRIEDGRLVVIGSVLDLNNQYGLGAKRLIIININGETDPARLRAMRHLVRLDKRLLDMVGRPTPREKPPETKQTEKPAAGKKKKQPPPAKK